MELQFGTGHKHKMSCSWRQEGNICNDLITIYLIIKLKCVQQESNWHVQVCRMKNCSAINMRWSTSYLCLFLITKYYFAFNNFFILFILFQSNFVPNLNIYCAYTCAGSIAKPHFFVVFILTVLYCQYCNKEYIWL